MITNSCSPPFRAFGTRWFPPSDHFEIHGDGLESELTSRRLELYVIDLELKKVLLPPLGNFADISYLEENFKPHLLRDVCTLCSGVLVSDSLLHMLL